MKLSRGSKGRGRLRVNSERCLRVRFMLLASFNFESCYGTICIDNATAKFALSNAKTLHSWIDLDGANARLCRGSTVFADNERLDSIAHWWKPLRWSVLLHLSIDRFVGWRQCIPYTISSATTLTEGHQNLLPQATIVGYRRRPSSAAEEANLADEIERMLA